MNPSLFRRVAFITGGSRGLGLAIANRFAMAGAVGVLFDLPTLPVPAVLPTGFICLQGDVTQEETVAAALAATAQRFGSIDILVANAGLVPAWRETEALDMQEWSHVMAVNVGGMAATLKHAVPFMKERGGAVVVMASINATTAHARQMLYTASKHAVLGIVRAAAQDLGRHGIRVNALAPGPIATDALIERIRRRAAQNATAPGDELTAMAAQTALGRLATEDDVANAALFLASDLSAGITKVLLPVDAGI